MSLNSLSLMATNVQLSGCPAKVSPSVATHVSQLLHLSHWRPVTQSQSARHCAIKRGGRLSAQASVTQTQTQDLAKSQKVVLHSNSVASASQQAVLCIVCRAVAEPALSGHRLAFLLLQASPERVGDVMTKKHVFTCNPDTSIDDGQC